MYSSSSSSSSSSNDIGNNVNREFIFTNRQCVICRSVGRYNIPVNCLIEFKGTCISTTYQCILGHKLKGINHLLLCPVYKISAIHRHALEEE